MDADRRQVDHVLTDSGRQALDAADAAVAGRLREIAGCLGDQAESERAFDGLAGVAARLRSPTGWPGAPAR